MIPEVKDRNVEFPNRYRLVKTDTGEDVGIYDLVEETGNVYEEGTVVDAELLNALREGVERAEQVDIAFFERLKAEEEGRADSEAAINERITQEQDRAEAAEDGLQTNLETEIERVEGLINEQDSTLTGEIARLDGELDAETLARQGEITRVDGLITDEEERATTQEGILDDKIDAEINRAKGKEGELETAIANTRSLFRLSESSVSSSFSGQTELETAYLIGGGTPRVSDHVLFPDNKSLVTYIGTVTAVNGESITVDNIEYINDALKPSGEWVMGVIANFPEVYNYQGGTYLCLGRDISTEPVKGKEWFELSAKPLIRSVAGKTGDVTLSTEDIEGLTELLGESVEGEKQRALAAEKALEDKITAEESRATQEEARVAGLVSEEQERAEEQEGVLDAKIDMETSRAEGVEETLKTAISDEQSRAEEAEQANTAAIAAETTRAQAEEKKVSDAVTAESSRAQREENTLSAAIETEETRATAAENAVAGRVTTIEGKIPTAASSTNKLVDRDTMNSTITSSAAFFRGSFETKEALDAWQTQNPTTATNNDYCYVQDDETQGHQAWRYIYSSSEGAWKPQFKVNNAPLNADQIKALNSGITTDLVGKITETEQGLASEISRAQAAEQKNASAISGEITRATAAEGVNAAAITAEETRAKAAEKKNADAITALQTKNTSQDTAINEAQETADAAMPKAGGTFTGAVTLAGAPTANLHAATKKYVDDTVAPVKTTAEAAQSAVTTEAARAKKAEEQNASDISDLSGRVDDVETTANGNKSSITDLTNRMTLAEKSITAANSKNDAQDAQLLSHNTGITSLQASISTMSSSVDQAAKDANEAKKLATSNEGRIATLEISVNGKYTKPQEGIPASDLAGDIPTSKITGLAAVAKSGKYSDLTGTPTIPTIPSSLPPTGTAGGDLTGTYPNPTIGTGKITKAKLESSVQTSLGKADTALQSHQSLAGYAKKTEVPRPTYYKLNGTAMTDTGGVGTNYTLALSNLTPSSPTPIVGDTVVFNTTTSVYVGTVTTVQTSAVVAQVKLQINGESGGGGNNLYLHNINLNCSNVRFMYDATKPDFIETDISFTLHVYNGVKTKYRDLLSISKDLGGDPDYGGIFPGLFISERLYGYDGYVLYVFAVNISDTVPELNFYYILFKAEINNNYTPAKVTLSSSFAEDYLIEDDVIKL